MMDNSSTSPSHEQTSQPRPVASNTSSSRSRAVCHFYSTMKGCRAGDQCPYRHVEPPSALAAATVPDPNTRQASRSPARAVAAPPAAVKQISPTTQRKNFQQWKQRAVVSKPVAPIQKQDPREFQITQIVRRFSPTRKDATDGSTSLVFRLVPSDPDFPFELGKGLECELVVPEGYSQTQNAKPLLQVNNADMPRGYQINVERGFSELTASSPAKTLLQLLNEVDKKLEAFLTAEKAQTVKIVANRAKSTPVPAIEEPSNILEPAVLKPTALVEKSAVVTPQPVPRLISVPSYTKEELAAARSKREADVRQLESRMRTVTGFKKSLLSYDIPLAIPRPERLPVALQAVKEVTLYVPSKYNLEPCTIMLKGVSSEDATSIELGFEKHTRAEPTLSLMAHLNWLTHHIHTLPTVVNNAAMGRVTSTVVTVQPQQSESPPPPAQETPTTEIGVVDADRPHIHVIPRPPEWDIQDNSDDESSEESFSEDDSDEDEDEVAAGVAVSSIPSNLSASNNSILISFPGIELFSIELLEIAAISLALKCDRCKTAVEINNLKASPPGTTTTTNTSCPKCTSTLSAAFHSSPIHANSIKAGHLDLTSCTVNDMLSSTFIPTCSECSTPFPNPPGAIAVRGDSTLVICRECHKKLTFRILDVKFLRVASSLVSSLPLRDKKKKENLGITAGTPLPKKGACTHYKKSMRWFRFSCCNKVYPCDRCHDEQADPKHTVEHANRMICGWCSKEQNYRPDDCAFCRSGLVGKRGGGFWEGGKGTRDKARMSRKDPRKYKRRVGGSKVGG